MTAQPIPTAATGAAPQHGATIVAPLNRLKASPRNARKTPHAAATIEAFAASILAKGVLQPPVVEVERNGEGAPTGNYLVTIGEGRRQALRLLARRKAIRRTHPVRVIVDAENDAHEISLDENMTREAMHPADQFEAFRRLADERGFGAEEIGARFGVSAHVVRQRLRLGAAGPELMAAYRADRLTLDQLTAFCVSEDAERQKQVLAQTGPHTPAYAIRRAMTETKVRADDRRARFVGVEAYAAAGGSILRDLFTEDGGGWFEDVVVLDRLTVEKLRGLADAAREREGWKWSEAWIDFPHDAAFGRVWPTAAERSEAESVEIAALSEEYDRLVSETDTAETLRPEVDARLEEIDRALQDFGPDFDYPAEAKARAGVVVVLGHDGAARFERGLVRAEDAAGLSGDDPTPEEGETDPETGDDARPPRESADEAKTWLAPLSDRLMVDLTARKTMGLRDALQADPTAALTSVVHALALSVFYPGCESWTPLQLRLARTGLERYAPGVGESPSGRRVSERCDAWAARLPDRAEALWPMLAAMPGSDLLDLLACCAGIGLHAVRDPNDRRPRAWDQAETLATAVGLDMTTTWSPTAAGYFGRVSKARVLEAVAEAADAEAAGRISGMKKAEMTEAAERLVDGRNWLPPVLRTAPAGEASSGEHLASAEPDVGSVAAE